MLLGIWHMGTLSGEHLKTVDMCLLCFRDRILIFLLPSFARKCSDLELSSYPDVWKSKYFRERIRKHRENPILWEKLSPQLLESVLKGIVGFKIKVGEIQAAYKLCQ